MYICSSFPAYASKANHRVNRRTRLYMCLSVCRHRSLDFSEAISDVVCLSFDASFNTFEMGLFMAKPWALALWASGPFRVLGWPVRTGGICWSGGSWIESSGGELVGWCASLNALDGLNAKWSIIHTLPSPFSYSTHPRFFSISILMQIS